MTDDPNELIFNEDRMIPVEDNNLLEHINENLGYFAGYDENISSEEETQTQIIDEESIN